MGNNTEREDMSMFREMVRFKQQLTQEECVKILKEEPRGVLSVLGDGDYPYGVPINQYYCEKDGRLYFHSGMKGHKIDAMKRHDKASFCTFDSGFRREGEWALNIKSVIVFGRIHIIEDHRKALELTRSLSRKYTLDEAYIQKEINAYGSEVLVFALEPEHITGKITKES